MLLIEPLPPTVPRAGPLESSRTAPAGSRAWLVNPGVDGQATPGPAGPGARTGGWLAQPLAPPPPPGRAPQRQSRPPADRLATGPPVRRGTGRAGLPARGTTAAAEFADWPGRGWSSGAEARRALLARLSRERHWGPGRC